LPCGRKIRILRFLLRLPKNILIPGILIFAITGAVKNCRANKITAPYQTNRNDLL